MKTKYILIIGTVLLLSLVGADVISINSGGGVGFIMNPDMMIEGFFSSANVLPVLSNLVLFSSSGMNTTNENLSVSYDSIDDDGNTITNITDWRLDGNSIAVLNMPFDKRVVDLTSGALRDYSTYENNGTLGAGVLANSPTWSSDCQVGGCYEFDGVNDYVEVSDDDDLDLTNAWTLSAWIKRDSIGVQQGIIEKYDWISGQGGYVLRILSTNKLVAYSVDGTSSDSCGTTITTLSKDVWYYVTATFDSNTNTLVCYINSMVEANNSAATKNPTAGIKSLKIGARGDSPSIFFNGSIDEVQIFNRALSPEQISLMYQAGLAGHQVETFVSQETDKGDVWQVAATPNDVFGDGVTVLSNELTIVDAVPEDPSSVSLVSLDGSNESHVDLNCSGFIEDKDNSLLDVYLNWLKDDVSVLNQTFTDQDNGTTVSSILDSGNLTLGDVWKCSIRVYDGVDYSSWVDSNELEIIDITAPNITVISPLSTSEYNYTTLEVDFNVSISDNEDGSACLYDLDSEGNVSMNAVNSTYYWDEPDLGPGNHSVIFYCNDTSDNWNSTSVDFNILNEAAISISISEDLMWGVEWYLSTLPVTDQHAIGNNGINATGYYINISATNTNVDLYMRADGDLQTPGLDTLGLGNETYRYNITDPNVSIGTNITMTTNYSLIGSGLVDGDVVYLKFFLDAPISQAAGIYLNGLDIKAVREGESP